jgi:hypothetical protein
MRPSPRQFFSVIQADTAGSIDRVRDSRGRMLEEARLIRPAQLRGVGRLTASVEWNGEPLAIAFAPSTCPFVEAGLADMLEAVAPGDFEPIPVRLEGVKERWCYLSVLQHLDCLDKDRSDLDFYTEEDGIPEAVGELLLVTQVVLRASSVPDDVRMFRLSDWPQELIVDEAVAWALQTAGVRGIELLPLRTT